MPDTLDSIPLLFQQILFNIAVSNNNDAVLTDTSSPSQAATATATATDQQNTSKEIDILQWFAAIQAACHQRMPLCDALVHQQMEKKAGINKDDVLMADTDKSQQEILNELALKYNLRLNRSTNNTNDKNIKKENESIPNKDTLNDIAVRYNLHLNESDVSNASATETEPADTENSEQSIKVEKKASKHKNRKRKTKKTKMTFACRICGYVFTQKSSRNRHEIRHNITTKSIACKKCSKLFRTERDVKQHLRSVHSSRRHECNYCGRTFAKKYNMEVHIAGIHVPSLRKYSCKKCKKRFASSTIYKRHKSKC